LACKIDRICPRPAEFPFRFFKSDRLPGQGHKSGEGVEEVGYLRSSGGALEQFLPISFQRIAKIDPVCYITMKRTHKPRHASTIPSDRVSVHDGQKKRARRPSSHFRSDDGKSVVLAALVIIVVVVVVVVMTLVVPSGPRGRRAR
jgi:hypothetical protein